MKNILILGAGVSGLTAGWRFSTNGFNVNIIEKSKSIGGHCGTFEYKGFYLDYGPHKFYSQINGIMPFYKNLLGEDCLIVKKKNSLRLFGKYFSFPPKPLQLLRGIGIFRVVKISFSFSWSFLKSMFTKKIRSYEDYFIRGFGKQFYNLIFRDLAYKMWGDPKMLSEELGRKRVPVPNIFSFVYNAIFGAKNRPDVSAEYFYYPKKGYNVICEKFEEIIKNNRGKIYLDSLPKKIIVKENKITGIEYEKDKKNYKIKTDYLVSSIPLTDLINILYPKVPKEIIEAVDKLKFRALILLYVFANKDKIIEDNWYFYPEKEFIFNRIAELGSFSPYTIPKGKACITVEMTCDKDDPFFNLEDEEIFNRAIKDLEKAGIIKREEVSDYLIKKAKRVYPIYDLDFRKNLDIVLKYLFKIDNLITIGRQGLFNYNNADHCIDMAIKSSDFVINKKPRQEWWWLLKYFDNYRIVD